MWRMQDIRSTCRGAFLYSLGLVFLLGQLLAHVVADYQTTNRVLFTKLLIECSV